MQMQPRLMDLQPQDVTLADVLARVGHCRRKFLECRAPLSEKDQAEQREGVGSVILDSQIGVGSGLEPFRTDLEREPPRLAVFSGYEPNLDAFHQTEVQRSGVLPFVKLRKSGPELECILSIPAAHRQTSERTDRTRTHAHGRVLLGTQSLRALRGFQAALRAGQR